MLTKKEMKKRALLLANELNAGVHDGERDFSKGIIVGMLLAFDEATTKKGELDLHAHSAIGCAERRWNL